MTFSTSGLRVRQIAGFSGTRQRDGNDSLETEYLVIGAEHAKEAEEFLLSQGMPPPWIDFTPPSGDPRIVKLEDYTWREATEGIDSAWLFTAKYSFEKRDVDEWSLSVSTSGGSIKMMHSLGTQRHGASPPDFKSLIDVRDGKPQGVDRILPAVRFNVTYRMQRPLDPLLFANVAADLTGTVNTSPILGSDAGELLFLGADGNFGNQINPELQFSWAKSKNASLSIGDIAAFSKLGHEYLWMIYEDDVTDGFVAQKPFAAYVEKVYTEANHHVLGLLL